MIFEQVKEKLSEQILDFRFFLSQEVLDNALSILEKLLYEEKEKFSKKLALTDSEISFDALEDESLLGTFFGLIEHFNSVESNDQLRQIIEDFEPLYVAWGNEVSYSKPYFDILLKIKAKGGLNSDQSKIIDESIKNFRIRGIDISFEKQDLLKDINQKVAALQQKFSNNVLDSEAAFSYLVEDESILHDMPNDDKEVARQKAEKQGKSGWIFDATWGSYASVLSYCSDRVVRKIFYTEKNKFASEGPLDNRQIILDILSLRSQKSELLGYKSYAHYSFEHKMAKDPDTVIELLTQTAHKAREKGLTELETLKTHFSLESIDYSDISYFMRKYKEQVFLYDEKELKNYFELEATLGGMFQIAQILFGVEFIELSNHDEKKYHSDIKLYEVKKDGETKAYFLGDYYSRTGKRPGAWANNIRSKYIHNGTNKLPIIVNVGNFQKSVSEKTLLPLRDVETLFHEFGHALHEMLGESHYAELSGFGVELDFVELPSQLMENWCSDKISLDLFARHCEHGAMIPQEILDRMKASENFGKGIFLLRQNEFSYLDLMLHSQKAPTTIQELDEKVFELISTFALLPRSPDYKMYTTFHHLFDGGYAAGYYSYMWSEMIEAQIWDVFKSEGPLSIEVGKRYYETILAQGSRFDGMDLFRSFTGKELDLKAFFARYDITSSS